MAILTREQLLASGVNTPPGYRDLADFLSELRAGRIPKTPAIERIADAFRRVLEREVPSSELDRALRLRPSRGRKRSGDSAEAVERVAYGRVCQFIWKHIKSDPKRRGARARAIEAAAAKFQKDVRTIERTWEQGRPALEAEERLAPLLAEFRRQQALVDRFIPREELLGPLAHHPITQVVGIAMERAAQAERAANGGTKFRGNSRR